MNKLNILFIITSVLFISACNEEESKVDIETKKETVHKVDWYKEHDAERKDMVAKCQNNPGELMMTPNCVNANKAKSSMIWSAKGKGTQIKPLKFN